MKLIMCQGLPGSGKTTFSKRYINDNLSELIVRVNKDEIRAEFEKSGWKWSHENEKDVIKKRDSLISTALSNGISVISDDTNLGKKHRTRLYELATNHGAEFEIKSFLDVPIEVCIERDSKREGKAKVGEDVIRKMAAQNGIVDYPIIEPYIPDPSLKPAAICDLDGTAALFEGMRNPYDCSTCENDRVNESIRDILIAMYSRFVQILYVSGRDEKFREKTEGWLEANKFPFDHHNGQSLFMRPEGDKRKDFIVKLELFNNNIRGKWDVKFVLDDRDQVVKMWRELGLCCLQVNYGNF